MRDRRSLAVIGEVMPPPASTGAMSNRSLGPRFKTLYGTGCTIDGVSLNALTYFAFFYFTAVCGLSGSLAGAAVFISLVVDALVDPLIGLISDRTRSRLGRRHVFMLASIAPFCVAFGLLFSLPHLTGSALFVYLCVVMIAVRVLLSCFNLPYYALGAELSDDYVERMSVVAYRLSFLMGAAFLSLALGLGIFMSGQNGLLNRAGYAGYGWTCAAIMLVAGLISFAGTRRIVDSLHVPPPTRVPILQVLRDELNDIRRSRSFLILFFATLSFWAAQGVSGALLLYMQKYFWALRDSQVQLIVLASAAGPILGLPIAAPAARRFEKKTIAIAGLAVMALSLGLIPLLQIWGVLALTRSALPAVLAVNALITGGSAIVAGISFQAMIADAADEHDATFGVRREGLFFAGLTLAVKASTGIGALVAGVGLDLIRFPVDRIAQPGLAIDPMVTRDLGLIAGPLPALIALMVPLVLLGYRLDRGKVDAIQQALSTRRRMAQ